MIRDVQDKDFGSLIKLFRSFFTTHNRFQQEDDKIIEYLKKQLRYEPLIVYEENDEIKGALFLVNFGSSSDNSHKLWKFRHFAFDSEQVASALLEEAEKRVKDVSATAKIELTIAESEPGIDFYKSRGYEQEASLKNHYRWGEICFILSKSIKK